MPRASRRIAAFAALACAALALVATAGDATFHGHNGLVAFRSDAGNVAARDSHAIWVVGADGAGARKVTPGNSAAGLEVDYSPVFFPDGRRLAYVRQLVGREFAVENQIFVKSVSAPPNAAGSPVLPAPVDYRILSLSVSPNGRQLVLAAAPPPLAKPQVFTLDLDGGEMTQVTSGGDVASTPEFSPDGRQIIFTSRFHDRGGIVTVSIGGSGLRSLTGRRGDGAPSFSPSGDRIAFVRHAGGRTRVFTMRADGSGVAQLTHGPAADRGPVFSPDGGSIVFARSGGNRNPDLYVMRSDGSGVHLLYAGHDPRVSDFGPDWGPKPR